jgi:hypothetical protein
MNASRASSALLALAAAVLWAGEALAQQGQAPISLFPPTVAEPPEDGAAPAGPDATVPSESAGETPRYDGIEVDRLGELNPDSLGILDLNNGGLGPDTWAGLRRSEAEALLTRLPEPLTSPTLRSLASRLLLSSAAAPQVEADRARGNTVADAVAAVQSAVPEGGDFLRLRAERLYAMGEVAGLNRLLSLVPQRVEDPWLAEARVDGLLLAGRDSEACGEVSAGLARYPQELYWSKVQVYCLFAAEQTDQALLGLDLLREQAPDSDPAFFELANGFISGRPPELGAAALSPLTLAMLRKSGGGLPLDRVAEASPLVLQGIAGLTGASAEVRAAAVERLVEVGALPGDRLAAVYDAFDFSAAELADALGVADAGVRGRALLLRAAAAEVLPTARAELLRAAFAAAARDGRDNAMARTALPLLAQVAPTPDLAWFAPVAARALFRVGQLERAGAWLSVLRIDGLKNPDSQATYLALRPLRRLLGGAEPLTFSSGEVEAALSEETRMLLLLLSRALGQEETLAWDVLGSPDQDTPLPRLAQLLALSDAAAAGRRGATVLLTLSALGEAAPAESHPLALGYAVSALVAAGLGNEARALAVEAALASGL